MKLLNQYLDPADATSARELLSAAGIASLVEAMDPHSIQPSKSGATHVGLWVLADDQLDDAIKVLENPDHVPRRVLTPAEITRLEKRANQRVQKSRLLDKALLVILVACFMGLIVFTAADYFLGL